MNRCLKHILIIETSSRRGSVAIATEASLVQAMDLPGKMRHAGELLPTVDQLLKNHHWRADSLTDVFVSIGPGSFTGLRIAVSVARTLAWSMGARIIAVPTLEIVARNALDLESRPRHVAVILDAKKGLVYAAAFEWSGDRYLGIMDAHLDDPRTFLGRCPRPLVLLGEGIAYHRQAVDDSGAEAAHEDFWWPRADKAYSLGLEMAMKDRSTAGGELMPHYIRRPEAEEKWEMLHSSQT